MKQMKIKLIAASNAIRNNSLLNLILRILIEFNLFTGCKINHIRCVSVNFIVIELMNRLSIIIQSTYSECLEIKLFQLIAS